MAITLATLRDRIRTQLMNASGWPEPYNALLSTETLTTLRDRIETRLQDSTNLRFATGDIDEAMELAIEQWSRYDPLTAETTVTTPAAGREIDISAVTGLMRVEKVWTPYTAATPEYPANWVQFEVWPGPILYIDEETEPAAGAKVRIWYSKMHTINGLNGAAATSLPAEDIAFFINGAAALAVQQRAIELAEELNVDSQVVKRLNDWADEMSKNFRYGMGRKQPAWQRRAYAYNQDDITEGIRWALGRYNEINPNVSISTLTLAAAGREVDISSLTGYLDITRVWWNYDSTSPSYPPDLREFEVWPGDLLFVKDGGEPQTGDKVRVWYKHLRTIADLDSAAGTTLPAQDEQIIIAGASGFCAQERVQEQPGVSVPRKLREWGDARLREFERGLNRLAGRLAARNAGLATVPATDRWDNSSGWS